jgi:hypothetical protein
VKYSSHPGEEIMTKVRNANVSKCLRRTILFLVGVAAVGSACCLTAEELTADVAKRPPPLNFKPGPEYAGGVRMFQGIPGVERAANGRLWATWYGGGKGEDRHNYIMLVTSGDDGKTWSDLKLVIDPDGDGPCRAFDPCLWHDPQGRLWLFWAERHESVQLWAITTEASGSENPKWSAPKLIHEGIMMDKPIVAADGQWLLPVAVWHREGSAMVVGSRDAGATWQLLGQANIPKREDRDCDEPQIVQRRDGSLWMLVRTRYGIGQTVSSDGGKTWGDVEPSSIAHTTSRFFICRLASGKLLLVKHGQIAERADRSHLTAFLSDDDGKTWHGGLLLDERLKVSYPDAVQASDGTIYLIYDYDRYGDKDILMATFREEDVASGKTDSPTVRLRILVNQATGKLPPKEAAP